MERDGRSLAGHTDLEAIWDDAARTVVLVEGPSDKRALEALAERQGRNLAAEGVFIVPMGGAHAIGGFLERLHASEVRLAGLCDAAEEGQFRRALNRAGLGADLSRDDMESFGFFVCVADLEDELIRSIGPDAVEQVIEAQGELGSFRTFQKQPAWRGRAIEEQLRRFIGTHSGRKIQSAGVLAAAPDLARVPRPLDRLLAFV